MHPKHLFENIRLPGLRQNKRMGSGINLYTRMNIPKPREGLCSKSGFIGGKMINKKTRI